MDDNNLLLFLLDLFEGVFLILRKVRVECRGGYVDRVFRGGVRGDGWVSVCRCL